MISKVQFSVNSLSEALTVFWPRTHTEIIVCNLQFYLLLDGMLFQNTILAVLPRRCGHFEKHELKQNKGFAECWNVQMCEVCWRPGPGFSSADHGPRPRELCCPLLGRKERVAQSLCRLSVSVPPVSDAGEVYDWHCPRDGIPQQQELYPPRPCSSQLHVSLHLLLLQFLRTMFAFTEHESLQVEREHECLRGWLRPLQEDLQWRLLQTGEDLKDACEMDRYRKFGRSSLHHQERRG